MKKKCLLLVAIPLLIASCGGHQSPSSDESQQDSSEISSSLDSSEAQPSSKKDSSAQSSSEQASSSQGGSSSIDETGYELNFESMLIKDENGEYLHLSYRIPDSYFSFSHPSTTFKKELAIASLAFVTTVPYKEKVKETYEYYGFDNLVYSPDYELEETRDTLKYTIGHKELDNGDLINISISGCDYQKPWESNFIAGESGNHTGFQVGVDKIMPVINAYLGNYDMENTKVYINGYSRSAAVGNIVSTLLIDNETVKEENLYVYLLETPKGLDDSNDKEYKSIFNVFNSADVITYVAPSEYGLKRAGIDIDINKENADALLLAFNPNLKMPAFTPNDEGDMKFSNDEEFINWLISYLLTPIEDEENLDKDLSTRENYYNNAQGYMSYFIGLIFSLSDEVRADISDEFSKLGMMDMLALVQEDGPYNFLSPILDRNTFEYDKDELKTKSNGVLGILMQKPTIVLMMASEEMKNDLMRIVYYHTLETILPLLINL